MQTKTSSKYAQQSTVKLEKLLSDLSDQSELNKLLAELQKRYLMHYAEIIERSDFPEDTKTTSKHQSRSEPESQSKVKSTIPVKENLDKGRIEQSASTFPYSSKIAQETHQSKWSYFIESIKQNLECGGILLWSALLPFWLIRIIPHPALTLLKLARLCIALVLVPIILWISMILVPFKLLVLIITFGQVNLFETLFMSKIKDLNIWVAPQGFWKD